MSKKKSRKKEKIKSVLTVITTVGYGLFYDCLYNLITTPTKDQLFVLVGAWLACSIISAYYIESGVNMFDKTFDNDKEEEEVDDK